MNNVTVKFTEILGAETLIHLKNKNDEDLVLRLDRTDQLPEIGAVKGVVSEAKDVFLFDKEGNRLTTSLEL